MKHLLYTLFILALTSASIQAQRRNADLNRPFGWANCTSLTSGDDYVVEGGSAIEEPRTITLTSNGQDMRDSLMQAIRENDIIILDGGKGPFFISSTMRYERLAHKTIVGINDAHVCTRFILSPKIHALMNRAKVLESGTIADDRVFTLSNGNKVKEEREYRIRQLLIDEMQDPEEQFRHAGLFNFSDCQDIIVRNLSLVGPGAIDVGGDDLMTCSRGCRHLWIDHCDFQDGMDGNFDINSFSDFITISWCRFHYTERTFIHANTNLVGSNDRAEMNGQDNLNITYAFCEWGKGCDQRMPMARFGTIHLLNNFYNCAGNSAAVNPRFGSEFRIEGNFFAEGVKHIFHYRDPKGYQFLGNVYTEAFEQPADLGTVNVPYQYEPLQAKEVPAIVGPHAGATLTAPLTIGK